MTTWKTEFLIPWHLMLLSPPLPNSGNPACKSLIPTDTPGLPFAFQPLPQSWGVWVGTHRKIFQGMSQNLGNTIIAILQFPSTVSAVRPALQLAQVQGGLGVPVKCRLWMKLCTPFPKNILPPSGLARSTLIIYLQHSLHQIHSLHWRTHTYFETEAAAPGHHPGPDTWPCCAISWWKVRTRRWPKWGEVPEILWCNSIPNSVVSRLSKVLSDQDKG